MNPSPRNVVKSTLVGRETIRKEFESFSSRLGQFRAFNARAREFDPSSELHHKKKKKKKMHRLKIFFVRFEHVTFNFNRSNR